MANDIAASPGTARAEAKKVVILDALIEILKEGGSSALTIDALAARARTSKATIYRYWPEKTRMLIDAANRVIAAPFVPDMGSFRKELTHLLSSRMHEYRGEGAAKMFASLIGLSGEDDAFGAHVRLWIDTHQMATNMEIVRRAKKRGEIRDDVSAEEAATIVAGPLLYRMVLQQAKPDQKLVDALVDCVVRGLAPAEANRRRDENALPEKSRQAW